MAKSIAGRCCAWPCGAAHHRDGMRPLLSAFSSRELGAATINLSRVLSPARRADLAEIFSQMAE